MTLAEMKTLLEAINGFSGKVVYRAWPIGQSPALPFIVFYTTGDDSFKADDKIYYAKKTVIIELYSEYKDETSEALVEAAMDGIIYSKDETYIDDERMTLVTYTMEV